MLKVGRQLPGNVRFQQRSPTPLREAPVVSEDAGQMGLPDFPPTPPLSAAPAIATQSGKGMNVTNHHPGAKGEPSDKKAQGLGRWVPPHIWRRQIAAKGHQKGKEVPWRKGKGKGNKGKGKK